MLDTTPTPQALRARATDGTAWLNPAPAARYRLVVWGDGPPAVAAALHAAALGGPVALAAERLPDDRLLPSPCQALARAARDPLARFDSTLQRLSSQRAAQRRAQTAWRLTGYGVDVFVGEAAFVDRGTLQVAGAKLRFHRAAVAAASRRALPPIAALAELGFVACDAILSVERLPRRSAILGAGPAACEAAQALRRFGSEVHLLASDLALLPEEEPLAAQAVRRQLEREGIHLHLGWTITKVERTGAAKGLVAERHGRRQKLLADEIFVDVPQQPDLARIGLDAAGVKYDARGMWIDPQSCTTNPAIYALDDTDRASGQIVANALTGSRYRRRECPVPRCVETDPQVARVGLSRAAAEADGTAIETTQLHLPDEGQGIVHTSRRSGEIVGATVVAPHAREMIGTCAMAMAHRLPLAALAPILGARAAAGPGA